MDGTVVLSPEKLLQQYLGFLSKYMTGPLVQKMSCCLCRSNKITKHEEQVITSQSTDMQKASRLIQIVIKKGQNACSSFLSCLGLCNPALYENVTGFPAHFSDKGHQHLEEIPLSDKVQFTPYIINIQNSSLSNCIIGNNNNQCITCDQHALLPQNDAISEEETADPQSHDQLIPPQDTISGSSIIQVEKSSMEYVIIGDHNSMTVTESCDSDVEENTETEADMIS